MGIMSKLNSPVMYLIVGGIGVSQKAVLFLY